MKPTQVLAPLASALVFCAACSGADEPRPRYSSTVNAPGTQQVRTLDDAQKQDLCQSFDVYASTYVDLDAIAYLACLPVALWTTPTQAACQASLDECLSAFPKPISIAVTAHTQDLCFTSLEQCNATVAQLEGCANVNVDRALEIYKTWSCARVTDPSYREMAKSMSDLVDVCVDVNDACNEFASVGPD